MGFSFLKKETFGLRTQETFTGNRCAITHVEQLNCVLANVIEEWLLSLSSVDTKDEIKEIKRKLLNK